MNQGIFGFPQPIIDPSPSDALGIVTMPAFTTINAGDLVCLSEGGYLYRADGNAGGLENYNSSSFTYTDSNTGFTYSKPALIGGGTQYLNANTSYTYTNGYYNYGKSRHIVSSDNKYVFYVMTDGGYGVRIYKMDVRGRVLNYSNIDTSTTANSCPPVITQLLNNNLVVTWYDTTGTTLYFMILDMDFNVVTAKVTVTSSFSNSDLYGHHCSGVLTTGDFIIVYSVSGDVRFKRYNSSGTIQGSEVVVEATCTPYLVVLVPCRFNSDFVISYYRNTATNAYKFARYNSSGTLQGSLTTISTQTGLPTIVYFPNDCRVIELSNGNIVHGYNDHATSDYAKAKIYDTSNSVVNDIWCFDRNYSSGFGVTPVPHFVAHPIDGTFYALNQNNSSCTVSIYNNDGSTLLAGSALGVVHPNGYPTSNGYIWRYAVMSAHGLVVGNVIYDNSAFTGHLFYTVNRYLPAIPNSAAVYSGSGYANVLQDLTMCVTPSGLLHFASSGWATTGSPAYNIVKMNRTVIFGVALSSGGKNDPIDVATKGNFTLPSSQNFVYPETFDNRAGPVIGPRGIVAGNTCQLYGLNYY